MEDPTTLALNLTFLGTLGVAGLMFMLLGFLVVLTLVIAGIARLVSIILLAMVGVFPKRDTMPIVHLPPTPTWFPEADSAPEAALPEAVPPAAGEPLAAEPVVELPTAAVAAAAVAAAASAAAASAAAASAAVPLAAVSARPRRNFFKPAQFRAWAKRAAATFFTSQGKHHPLVAALTHEPPVLSEKWAAAVAQADERAAARAKAAELPKIVVTVREVAPSEETEPRDKPVPTEKTSQGAPSNGGTPQGGATKNSPRQPVHGGSLTSAAGARPRT
ncbi:hypothetical protein [Arthrobacter sp. CJ23]|uniref:hypothetical protein n=1 Tax=Arthrobacter sp. CJ23 TaxID=2972479 RepID=UPI00215CB463|nr:hypothetical protein [Arthrobacter sp. CJ23]UVJ39329.1 hypothetical protein NVV90_19375 [Arthrobacter sp. CJ23]